MKKTSYASDLAMDISGITHQIINITARPLVCPEVYRDVPGKFHDDDDDDDDDDDWRSSMNGRV